MENNYIYLLGLGRLLRGSKKRARIGLTNKKAKKKKAQHRAVHEILT